MEAQFDPDRTLVSYYAVKVNDYKMVAADFFKFYSTFDYDLVISTHHGRSFTLQDYELIFPKYKDAFINIPGPVNQVKLCEAVNIKSKLAFVNLCEASSCLLACCPIR